MLSKIAILLFIFNLGILVLSTNYLSAQEDWSYLLSDYEDRISGMINPLDSYEISANYLSAQEDLGYLLSDYEDRIRGMINPLDSYKIEIENNLTNNFSNIFNEAYAMVEPMYHQIQPQLIAPLPPLSPSLGPARLRYSHFLETGLIAEPDFLLGRNY